MHRSRASRAPTPTLRSLFSIQKPLKPPDDPVHLSSSSLYRYSHTHRYMVDEICRGRWYGKENGSETAITADLDKLMGSLRYSKDSDMFSIIANRSSRLSPNQPAF